MTPDPHPATELEDPNAEPPAPACVMCFNASDASGAAGLARDIAAVAALGAQALAVGTSIVMRDTADVFDQHAIDADAVAEQARTVLEDLGSKANDVAFLFVTVDPGRDTPEKLATSSCD